MSIFRRRKQNENLLNPQSVATGFCILYLQVLSAFASELNITQSGIRSYFAPVLAATTRASGNDKYLIREFLRGKSANVQVEAAIAEELLSPQQIYYEPIIGSMVDLFKQMSSQITTQGYESALVNSQVTNNIDRDAYQNKLEMVFKEFALELKPELRNVDDVFLTCLSTATAQHIYDLWSNLPLYGAENSRLVIGVGSTTIATSLLLYFIGAE